MEDKELESSYVDEEATFEIVLDSRSCYVTRKFSTAMEPRYLKPTLKSGPVNYRHLGCYNIRFEGANSLFTKKKVV